MPLSEYYLRLRQRAGHELILMPGVCGLVFDDADRILLHRRSDTGKWAVLGGMMDPGEQPADAVVREVLEETGVQVVPERITGVYLTQVFFYPDGNCAQFVITTFRCRSVAGEPHAADEESLEAKYFPLDQLPELSADHRARLEHALRGEPYFSPPTRSSSP